jgi:hypothetical protein
VGKAGISLTGSRTVLIELLKYLMFNFCFIFEQESYEGLTGCTTMPS